MNQPSESKNNLGKILHLLISGAFTGVMICIFAITYSSLIFFGELEEFKTAGISFALVGAVILNLVFSRVSSYPNMVAVPQVEPALILGLMGVTIAEALTASGNTQALFPTMTMAIFISSIAIAFAFLLIWVLPFGKPGTFYSLPCHSWVYGRPWMDDDERLICDNDRDSHES